MNNFAVLEIDVPLNETAFGRVNLQCEDGGSSASGSVLSFAKMKSDVEKNRWVVSLVVIVSLVGVLVAMFAVRRKFVTFNKDNQRRLATPIWRYPSFRTPPTGGVELSSRRRLWNLIAIFGSTTSSETSETQTANQQLRGIGSQSSDDATFSFGEDPSVEHYLQEASI